MTNSRKVKIFIASSLDGFIAEEDGNISWLNTVEKEDEDYGYGDFIKTIDIVITGRKTYDKIISIDPDYNYFGKNCFVLSRETKGKNGNIIFYNDDPYKLVEKLKKESGKDIYVDGGSEIIMELRKYNLIDEYIISIIPVLLGKGVKLFADAGFIENLIFGYVKSYSSGLVQIKYIVNK